MHVLADAPLVVEPGSSELPAIVRRHAPDDDRARRLRARVLLHLPRLADERGCVPVAAAEREVARLAAEEDDAAPGWLRPPARSPASPLELELVELHAARARVVHERFHYLRSYRSGLHLGGTADERVAVLLTFSPLDLAPVGAGLPAGVEPEAVRVLSRAWAAAWAPRNSLSRMLALAARELRAREPQVRLLLTYLNPAIGFDGASYKAANWSLYGYEHGTRYTYLDAAYVTDRELTRRFGTSDAATLERLLPGRVVFSRMPLPPLELYACAIDPRLRELLAASVPRGWVRPWA